jgi:phage FluMu protein gp41
MTYTELERLVLALPPADAARLVNAVTSKLGSIAAADSSHPEVREAAVPDIFNGGHNAMEAQVQLLLEKLTHLPPRLQAEVGDFIEFLHQRELAQLTSKDFAQVSENAFAKIWENNDDALYDKL